MEAEWNDTGNHFQLRSQCLSRRLTQGTARPYNKTISHSLWHPHCKIEYQRSMGRPSPPVARYWIPNTTTIKSQPPPSPPPLPFTIVKKQSTRELRFEWSSRRLFFVKAKQGQWRLRRRYCLENWVEQPRQYYHGLYRFDYDWASGTSAPAFYYRQKTINQRIEFQSLRMVISSVLFRQAKQGRWRLRRRYCLQNWVEQPRQQCHGLYRFEYDWTSRTSSPGVLWVGSNILGGLIYFEVIKNNMPKQPIAILLKIMAVLYLNYYPIYEAIVLSF